MRHYRTFWVVVGLCALLSAGCGPQGEIQIDLSEPGERQAAITDGTPHAGHPSVGFVLAGGSTSCNSTGLAGAICTATLVGKRTVLLAAHCILAGKQHIFCQAPGSATYLPETMTPHPKWDPQTLQNDIAVIMLKTAPPVTPSIISDQAPSLGQKVTLVGFGCTATGVKDAGIKRIAHNYISKVETTRFAFKGSGNGTGSTCKGDSGGPAFATYGGKEVQVGVTSSGLTPCGVLAYDTRVDAFYSWVKTTAGGDIYDGSADTAKPVVTITSPSDDATVNKSVTVSATVSDDVGVVDVGLYVNGALKANKTSPPYNFPATLADGQHTLKVVATDGANNQGTAQITVKVGGTVSTEPPAPPSGGGYGAKCDAHDICQSQMCANATFCTQTCDPAANTCPTGAQCVSAGGSLYVCGPPSALGLDDEALVGGCVVGAKPRAPLGLLLALGLLLLWVRRRAV
jgi:secreted trypsin-like serine protease